ncbi:MAG: hypothetical protein WCS94_17190 [Verrucomicrobiota bacterium]
MKTQWNQLQICLLIPGLLATAIIEAQPVITLQPTSQTAAWSGNATYTVAVTGVGPFTYEWQMNGTNLLNNMISTVAGGKLNDGLPATNTILDFPQGSAVDAAGNLYIADMNNHVIRKVDPNGISRIIVGAGVLGFAGDGGAATNAFLNKPTTVAVDSSGKLYLADSGNNRIRMVSTNGIITTVAGNGSISGGGLRGHEYRTV